MYLLRQLDFPIQADEHRDLFWRVGHCDEPKPLRILRRLRLQAAVAARNLRREATSLEARRVVLTARHASLLLVQRR